MSDTAGYERAGRLMYGMQRTCGGLEGLAGLAHDPRVLPGTLRKSRALAAHYKDLEARCIANADAVTDAEVNALLIEARELDVEVAKQCGPDWMFRPG